MQSWQELQRQVNCNSVLIKANNFRQDLIDLARNVLDNFKRNQETDKPVLWSTWWWKCCGRIRSGLDKKVCHKVQKYCEKSRRFNKFASKFAILFKSIVKSRPDETYQRNERILVVMETTWKAKKLMRKPNMSPIRSVCACLALELPWGMTLDLFMRLNFQKSQSIQG